MRTINTKFTVFINLAAISEEAADLAESLNKVQEKFGIQDEVYIQSPLMNFDLTSERELKNTEIQTINDRIIELLSKHFDVPVKYLQVKETVTQ